MSSNKLKKSMLNKKKNCKANYNLIKMNQKMLEEESKNQSPNLANILTVDKCWLKTNWFKIKEKERKSILKKTAMRSILVLKALAAIRNQQVTN